MNYLQTLEVSVVWEDCYLNKSFRYACPGLEGSGDGAQALGGRHGGLCPRAWLVRSLPSQKLGDVDQIANLGYGPKPLICLSFSFSENGPDLELEKGLY